MAAKRESIKERGIHVIYAVPRGKNVERESSSNQLRRVHRPGDRKQFTGRWEGYGDLDKREMIVLTVENTRGMKR